MTKPWDKQPGETPTAFHAFSVYRDLGPDRSLSEAYRAYSRAVKGRGKAESARAHVPGSWRRWAKSHDWSGRCAQFDASLYDKMSKAQEAALDAQSDEWARRQVALREVEWKRTEEMMEFAGAVLKQYRNEDGSVQTGREGASVRDAAALIRIASEVGRAATRLGEDGGTAKVVREHADEILEGQSAMELERTYRELFGDA